MNKLGVAIVVMAVGAMAACGDSGSSTSGSGGGGTGGAGSGGSGSTTTTSTTTTTTTTTTTGGNAATCADFCADYLTNCSANTPEWTVAADCETDCAAWAQGTPGATSGDTLECRFYHVTAAAGDPATHCPHAGSDGGGVCI